MGLISVRKASTFHKYRLPHSLPVWPIASLLLDSSAENRPRAHYPTSHLPLSSRPQAYLTSRNKVAPFTTGITTRSHIPLHLVRPFDRATLTLDRQPCRCHPDPLGIRHHLFPSGTQKGNGRRACQAGGHPAPSCIAPKTPCSDNRRGRGGRHQTSFQHPIPTIGHPKVAHQLVQVSQQLVLLSPILHVRYARLQGR